MRRYRGLTAEQVKILADIRDHDGDGGTLEEIASRVGSSRWQVAARLSEVYKRFGIPWMPHPERRAAALAEADKLGVLPAKFTPAIVDVPTGELL